MKGAPRARLFVESSFIGSGHYAVAESAGRGSSLYFGSLDGSQPISIDSRGNLAEPFILSKSLFLAAERLTLDPPMFRILEFNVSINKISCRILIKSKDYLGFPYVRREFGDVELLFYSGEFDARASGSSVIEHHITALRGEEYIVLAGSTFLAIDRLAQVGSDGFIARSFGYSPFDVVDDGAGSETDLVDIRIMKDRLTVKPFDLKGFSAGPASSVTTSIDGGTAIVVWSESRSSGDMFATAMSLPDGRQVDTILLPTGRRLSGIFPDAKVGGRLTGWMLSSDRVGERGAGVVTLTRFSEGKKITEGTVSLEASKRLNTDSCH